MKVSRNSLFLLFLLLLLFPAVAQAKTTVVIKTEDALFYPDLQGWTDRAWGGLPTPNDTVDVYLNASVCPVAPACAVPRGFWNKPNPTIWLNEKYVKPDRASQDALRQFFFHELGHVFDYIHLDDIERNQIVQVLGFRDGFRWFGDPTGRPNELFAEGASACWFGPRFSGTSYGYSYSFQETAPLCRAISGAYSNNNQWFGQRIIPAERKFFTVNRKVLNPGPPVQWGGRYVTILYKGNWIEPTSCSGTVRFDKRTVRANETGTVSYNVCGSRVKLRSTLPKPFKFGYWDIPRQAPKSSG